jgi:hypothetical protein
MDECCCQTTPGTLQLARAVSILQVRCFHIFVFLPAFCGRRWFRKCNVTSVDNGRCGFALPNQDSSATVPIFASNFTGEFDPCITSEVLVPSQPFVPSDTSLGCRLAPEFSGADCWDAQYSLTIETIPNDLIAACLANLALIDLNQVPFGTQRRVTNDAVTGAPIFSDSFIATNPSGAAACASPANHQLASSFAFEYSSINTTRHCTNSRDRRIEMPTQQLIVSATRSRFSATSPWCKRTRSPIFIDPDFSAFCTSQPGACNDIACSHYLAANGTIDLPLMNQSIHIGLCTAPAAPCNPTPIAF